MHKPTGRNQPAAAAAVSAVAAVAAATSATSATAHLGTHSVALLAPQQGALIGVGSDSDVAAAAA